MGDPSETQYTFHHEKMFIHDCERCQYQFSVRKYFPDGSIKSADVYLNCNQTPFGEYLIRTGDSPEEYTTVGRMILITSYL